jgi:hypothetical protein
MLKPFGNSACPLVAIARGGDASESEVWGANEAAGGGHRLSDGATGTEHGHARLVAIRLLPRRVDACTILMLLFNDGVFVLYWFPDGRSR